MSTLDSLSTVGAELTTEQMDTVDGGLLPVIVGLVILDVYIWGKVYDKYTS